MANGRVRKTGNQKSKPVKDDLAASETDDQAEYEVSKPLKQVKGNYEVGKLSITYN